MNTVTRTLRNITYLNCQHYSYLFKTLRFQYPIRYFNLSGKLNIKMFLEYENKHAYSIMEKNGYAISLMPDKTFEPFSKEQFESLLTENLTEKKPEELFQIFSKLAIFSSKSGLSITDSKFDNFIDHLTDNIKKANDTELQSIFYALSKWPETESINSRNYIEVWAGLDDVCLKRLPNWSFDTWLSFISLFYMLNITKGCDFSMKAIQKLASKAKQLTPPQLVKTLFFVGILRKPPFDMHNLEIQLNDKFSSFTVDELAIMSMGFFKSKTPIRSKDLQTKIVNKIMNCSRQIHEVSLAALLKVLRYSMKNTPDQIYNLLDKLELEVPRLSVMCCVHMALLGSAILTRHEKCLDKIAETFCQNTEKARVKDIERLILTYGILNYVPQINTNFFEIIMGELRNPAREPEFSKYPHSFVQCISYLGLLGIYPEDLINKVLDPVFLERTYGRHPLMYGREVLTIHNSVKIFFSNSEINCLSDKAAVVMAKKFTDYMPDANYKKQFNFSEKMILDVMNTLREARQGHDYVLGDHILTHYQRGDIIICNDKNGSPMPVTNVFPTKDFGKIHKPPDSNTWIVLILAGRNAIIRNRNIVTGPFQRKIVELRKLNYKAGLVQWDVWSTLQNNNEKQQYLNKLIEESVNVAS